MRKMSWQRLLKLGHQDEKGYVRKRNVIIRNNELGVRTSR